MMATELILATLAVIVGLIYSLIRSRKNRNRMLSAAARRQKHAPKESLAPRRLNSKGKAVQHASDGQSSATERRIESASKGTSDENLAEDASNGEHESQHESSNGATELTDSSRQIDQLSVREREEYDERDQERDQNLISLRLLVDDLFDESAPDTTSSKEPLDDTEDTTLEDQFTGSTIELRTTWIEQNEEPLNQHAAFVETEEIGSGIQVVETSTIVNDDIEQRLEREGGKTGEVQISLAWDDYNDLDLHIFCPSGERIYFNNKTSECGGELDVDMNVRPTSKNAVENVVWIENAPTGKYKVGVHFYKHHQKEETTETCEFRARITIHGDVRDYSGRITHGQAMQMVTSFTLKES